MSSNKAEFDRFRVAWMTAIARKDPDYKDYAGASPEVALMLAKIDTALFMNPPKGLRFLLKLWRIWLLQRKKAEFVSLYIGELSKLGALKGGKAFDIQAIIQNKPRT